MIVIVLLVVREAVLNARVPVQSDRIVPLA